MPYVAHSQLLVDAASLDIEVVEYPFKNPELKGLYFDGTITINSTAYESLTEKNCILAEEIGHYHTSYGNILDQRDIRNQKQEKHARNWAYERLVPLSCFVEAFENGIRNRYEFAEFIGVTEMFLDSSIAHYLEVYGIFVEYDGYVIRLDPLEVTKLIVKGENDGNQDDPRCGLSSL